MRIAATSERTFLSRPVDSGGLRYAIAVIVVALLTLIAASALQPVGSTDAAALNRTQQAWADRLTGQAETLALADITRSRQAEAARWQAMADYYRKERADRAATDRLTGLAEQLGVTGLSRAQEAEADRLTGLASYLEGTR